MRKSVVVASVSVFAAVHAVLYLVSFGLPLWRNWAIYLEPIEGIVLGPWAGFLAALIGSVIGRTIVSDSFWMFGIVAEPVSVLAVGFLAKGRWKPIVLLYAVMLAAYFAHPFGRWLPYWAILDILLALVLVYPVAKLSKNLHEELERLSMKTSDQRTVQVSGRKNLYEKLRRLPVAVPLSFIGTASDALTRVFLLIPVGLYSFLNWSSDTVYGFFVLGAMDSYFEDVLVVAVSLLIGVPLLLALQRIPGFKYPLT